jgi:hypothetical protein
VSDAATGIKIIIPGTSCKPSQSFTAVCRGKKHFLRGGLWGFMILPFMI